MSFFSDPSGWLFLILIMLGGEVWSTNRKLDEINKTLKEILAKLQRLP